MPRHILPRRVLTSFALKMRRIPSSFKDQLTQAGVSSKAVQELCETHASCVAELDHATLNAYYSLIPRFEEWIASEEEYEYKYSHEFPQWHGIIRNIDTLEEALRILHPRAAELRIKLDAWNNTRK